MPTPLDSLVAAFLNCIDRKCTADQLEGFLIRARNHWSGNEEMTSAIERLQRSIPHLN